jgi:NAD(P)-dependent dehydrogenase (short-subunit alcohol dehydrogenase family)
LIVLNVAMAVFSTAFSPGWPFIRGVSMDKCLQDRVCVVTGAASGIGRATARALADHGARLALLDVDAAAGRSLASELTDEGVEAVYLACDMADPASVDDAFTRLADRFGTLDCAFNNAGVEGPSAPLETYPLDAWERVMAVNLRGLFLCLRREVEIMRRFRSGSIINCASIAGLVGFAGASAYVASKHGVIGLTRSLALELAADGIRVNAVCPGVIDTPMISRATGGDAASLRALIAGAPMNRLGRPEEIASLVVWLASPASSYVTGQAIAADGGWTAR